MPGGYMNLVSTGQQNIVLNGNLPKKQTHKVLEMLNNGPLMNLNGLKILVPK